MNRAEKIISDKLIVPFSTKSTEYIGIEVELPVCCLNSDINTKEIGERFLNYIIEVYAFRQEVICADGSLMRVINEVGDSISFDYCYVLMEFSMAKSKNIKEVAQRFYTYIEIAQNFYRKENCVITGMGTNFRAPNTFGYTGDDFYATIRNYVEQYTRQKDPKYIFPFMQSVQTHIDVAGGDLLKCYNLFAKLDFVRGLLFSNSLPSTDAIPPDWSYPRNTLCARDFNWSNCGIPNTGIAEKDFPTMEALIEYLSNQKIFLNVQKGKLCFFKPLSLCEYFSNEANPDEDIYLYRSFERVVVNNLGHLEVRGDCTQPLKEAFASSAFSVGLAYNLSESREITGKFFRDNNITESNSVLREKAITSLPICDDKGMMKFLVNLIDCAKQGLLKRGYGEEIYLLPLYERVETLSCPAKKQLDLLENGVSMEDIILENSMLK